MPSALVLSAGLGTRLDPVTRLVAKPAVPLGDRTLIERVLAWLHGGGVRDVVLNLHHLPATITAVVGDGRQLGLRVRYSWEQPILGSAGGPRRALPLLESDPFVIVNGDTLCEVDLARMLAAHRASGASVTMAVVPHPAPDRYNGIVADAHGAVTAFVPRGGEARGRWHFTGVQIAAARVFADLPDGAAIESVSGVYRDLLRAQPGALRIFPVDADVVDVGTPGDYLRAALRFPTARTFPDARVSQSIVWPAATIGPGADLEACLVIGDARVPPGFRARAAILAPPALLRPGEPASGGLAVFRGTGLFFTETA